MSAQDLTKKFYRICAAGAAPADVVAGLEQLVQLINEELAAPSDEADALKLLLAWVKEVLKRALAMQQDSEFPTLDELHIPLEPLPKPGRGPTPR